MADSKFLKYQDQDNDGLIDVCDDLIQEEPFPCGLKCTPNPLAVIPKWTTQNNLEPWLNEKTCYYEVVKVTPYTSTVDSSLLEGDTDEAAIQDALNARATEFIDEIIETFLEAYNKEDTPDARSAIESDLEFHKYELPPRANSRLKLLYRVPFDTIDGLEDAGGDEETDEDKVGWTEVEFVAQDFSTKLIRVRRGLNMHGRYLKVFRGLDGGNILFWEDDSIFNLEDYGDPALFTPNGSVIAKMSRSLELYLNGMGLQIPGIGSGVLFGGFGKDIVMKIKFEMYEYKLKQITLWTEGCAEKPFYLNKKLKRLLRDPSWTDQTALAYLNNLYKMDAALQARVPEPWQDFIIEYTYPRVYSTISDDADEASETMLSCIGDALSGEIKELGQDIMDEVFSIGDIIAYKFKQSLCRYDMEEMRYDDAQMGLTEMINPDTGKATNIMAMAKMNAFKQLKDSDQVFLALCAKMLAGKFGLKNADKEIGDIYEYGLERIKVCGLFDLALDALKCLLNGLTLEQAMSSILKAALTAMNMENFGDLFIGLPPEKQAELDALVKKKFEDGDLFRPDSGMQAYSDALDRGGVAAGAGASPGADPTTSQGGADDTPFMGGMALVTYEKPWENKDLIAEERLKAAQNYQATTSRRSLADQMATGAASDDKLDPSLVMDLYIQGLLEVYQDNYLELMDEMNKFPGAQLIATLIAMFDCPMPPLLNPSIADFMKSFGLPFCQDLRELRVPRFWDPSEWYPDFVDIMKKLWDLIKIVVKQAVLNILILILVKICEILGSAICKALGTVGKVAASMPGLLTGRQQLRDVIKDSICGPDASDEMIDNTLVELFAQLGQGGAALADTDAVMKFAEDLSSSVTRRELSEAFLGEAPTEMLEVVDQLVEFEYPQFREGFRDPDALKRFFKNVGNLMPAQTRQDLRDFLGELPDEDFFPANPSLCLTSQQQDDFADLRCELLQGRASEEQCRTMFDNLTGTMMDDVSTLTSLMQNGVEETIMSNLPQLFSTPGTDCNDGIIPDIPEPTKNVASSALGNDFEMLKIDYSKDMLGNGGLFATDKGWGFMNLALSDTLGNPLTAHHRYSRNRKKYVNFASNLPNGGEASTAFFSFLQGNAGFSAQEGQFPSYVGEWLMRQFLNAGGVSDLTERDSETGADYELWPIENVSAGGTDLDGGNTSVSSRNSLAYNSTNNWQGDNKIRVSWEDLDFAGSFFGISSNVDLTKVPDFGYNTPISVDYGAEDVIILEKGRKKTPDVVLDYKDNAVGLRDGCDRGTNDGGQSQWSYGFEIHYFGNDLVDDLSFDSSGEESEPVDLPEPSGEYDITKDMSPEELAEYEATIESRNPDAITNTADGIVRNRADDNVRIKIIEKVNTMANVESPLSELVKDDLEKSDGFDFPDWFEKIPIVGWVVQALVNLVTKPFSNLIRPASAQGKLNAAGESVILNEKYEFLAVDDGLDGIDLTEYPNFANCFVSQSEYSPPVILLSEVAGISQASAKTEIDTWMGTFFRDFAAEIGTNQAGWKYGAKFDYLLPSDADYLDPATGEMYENIVITDVDGSTRPARNKDMILGVSRDQYENDDAGTPENTRVVYLNPTQYGGSYTSPKIHVKPIQFEGWLGLVQVLFPELSPCKPQRTDLIDFGEIQQKIDERISKIPEDPRLKHDPDCAVEVPYNRILDRTGKAGLMGVIEAAIRIYASTHFFKAIGTFSKIQPKFPDNFSNIYTQYIVEVMEEKFKESQHAFWEMFNPFKDDEFWFAFLEQSVQFYAWRLDAGEIQDPPMSVLNALRRLNDYQEEYDFPYPDDLREDQMAGVEPWLQKLSTYRQDKNLEAVQATEEDAKLILAELVGEQLTIMGNRLVENLIAKGYIPTIFDLDYWIFENRCAGSEIVIAGPEIVEEPQGLPTPENPDPNGTGATWPGPYYTAGNEFRIAEDNDADDGFELGDEYIGYYHGQLDDDGEYIYVVGEAVAESPPSSDPTNLAQASGRSQDLLGPIATLVKVGSIRTTKAIITKELKGAAADASPQSVVGGTTPEQNTTRDVESVSKVVVYLGDLPDLGTAPSSGQPFALEKFISINGTKMKPSDALNAIKGNNPQSLMSEVYPGTLKHLKNDAGIVVGLEGEMGVRYGLQFYYLHDGAKIAIADVAVDALDLPIAATAPFGGDSKLLFCLLNMMKSHPKYKMMTSYIFPIKKVTATLAMYNDLGFLSSIGEVTVGRGDYNRWVPMGALNPLPSPDMNDMSHWVGPNVQIEGIKMKPGSIAFLSESEGEDTVDDPYWGPPDGTETYKIKIKTLNEGKSLVGGNEGWVAYKNRKKGLFGGIGVLEWDNWDRVILRNSTSRIKKMFKGYYNSRTWVPGEFENLKPGQLWIENMKARMLPNPALGILPWFRRGKVSANPYNAKGELCDGPTG